MLLNGRIPLEEKLAFPTYPLAKGTLINQGKNNTDGTKKSIPFGNKCLHNKLLPKTFIKPHHHQGRPSQLESAKQNLRNAFFNRSILKKLNQPRQKRSEGMEAVCLIGEALLHYCDLATLQIGIPSDKEFLFLPIIPKAYKLDEFSLLNEVNRGLDDNYKIGSKRVFRALKALEKHGWLVGKRRYKKTTHGQFKAIVSAKRLTERFFLDLGIPKARLDRERKYRAKEIIKENERRKQTTKAIDYLHVFNQEKKNDPLLSAKDVIDARLEGAKIITDTIQSANPEWTGRDISMYLIQQLKNKKPP